MPEPSEPSEQRPLADHLRQQAGAEGLQTLVGLAGESDDPAATRIYLSPNLDVYIDVATDDIVHRQAMSGEQSAVATTAVWVRKGARVRHTRVVAADAQSAFLQGPVTDRYLGAGAPAVGPTGSFTPQMQCQYYTGDTFVWCESRYVCITGRCGGTGWC
ncbi:MAG TPA: hypothetical protein VHS52_04530 [Acidimicrobiales bacterium]|jgi:hypothetical protein|nr:hypothetical protein [Acidimicrobiales bacterium]